MNYLTKYYKNLSEQLQEKVNILNKLVEEKRKVPDSFVSSPNYDYELRSNIKAWEPQDIDPEITKKIAKEYSSKITSQDTEGGFKTRTTYEKNPNLASGKEALPRFAFDKQLGIGRPESKPTKEYSRREDERTATDVITGLGKIKNKMIDLSNERSRAEAEVIGLGGNMDLLTPAVIRAETEKRGEKPVGEIRDVIFDRMKEEEIARRKSMNKPVNYGSMKL